MNAPSTITLAADIKAFDAWDNVRHEYSKLEQMGWQSVQQAAREEIGEER